MFHYLQLLQFRGVMTVEQAINLAAALVGSKGKLCQELKISRQAMNVWKKKGVPLRRALEIQVLTNGAVMLGDLCPEYAGIQIVQVEYAA
jgi:DNA-binding transcriptional regulator YdaS (Cro superfamily)